MTMSKARNDTIKIKNIRQEMGFTRCKFAQLFGVNTATVYRWEVGIKLPDKNSLRYLYIMKELLSGSELDAKNFATSTRNSFMIGGSTFAIYTILNFFFCEQTSGIVRNGGPSSRYHLFRERRESETR